MRKLKNSFNFFFKKHLRLTLAVLLLLSIAYYFCLPDPLFRTPTSRVLLAEDGTLLGARIASDGQWRFPPSQQLHDKFVQSILTFEDKRFYQHPGVDFIGLARATQQNIRNRSVVSGGSTLTMQVIRLARGGKRNLWNKLVEMILATRLELRYTKQEILELYAANAPFGGNVVGLEAATWRYFGKRPDLLSWGEAATLAVLPNSPALIHPGRNRNALMAKRNRLLQRLIDNGTLDKTTAELAMEEPLPDRPLALPRLAPQLLDRAVNHHSAEATSLLRSTLDLNLQKRAEAVINRHHERLSGNNIHNLCAIVTEVKTGKIIAYIGNAPLASAEHQAQVDINIAPRSTGSILKPFLYAMAVQEGIILPSSLLPDVPTQMGGFRPENYYESFAGAVPADQSLSRSLNIPMVHLLHDYGLEKFHFNLKKLGLTTINRPSEHYGLSLILGGAEASLFDLVGAYRGMSKTLGSWYDRQARYGENDYAPLQYQINELQSSEKLQNSPTVLAAGAIYHTFEAMQRVERPNSVGQWERFRSSRRIAWKTGTSFGFRDAWAIGVTPEYVVGVWAGNADGEGFPGLVGTLAAGPVLFDLYELLPATTWFEPPFDDLQTTLICQNSGNRAGRYCPVDTLYIAKSQRGGPVCANHQLIHLNEQGDERVNSACYLPGAIQHEGWFVLPPLQEFYYKQTHPEYRSLPAFAANCRADDNPMELIYPKFAAKIYVPKDFAGERSRTVFKVAHRRPEQTIHWHLDETYVGSTNQFHSFEFDPLPGKHQLVLVDEEGHRLRQPFEVIEK